MIPGPGIVIAYPKCGAQARHPTLISSHTLGSQRRCLKLLAEYAGGMTESRS